MKKTFLKSIVTLFTMGMMAFLCQPSFAQKKASRSQVKLIEFGWEKPNTAAVLRNLKEIEAIPFDGIGIYLMTKDSEGKNLHMRYAFTDQPWKREWFKADIDNLKQLKSSKLTDNFLVITTQNGVDWFDDKAWKEVIDHWRIASWVAKESGLKGIAFDPESYKSAESAQMNYQDQPQSNQYTFDEYKVKARQRGKEVMDAIKSEYPDITLLSYFLNSYNFDTVSRLDANTALQKKHYNLLPAFIDGWLDAIPPEMVLVDGNEYAYKYNGELDYLRAANGIRNTSLQLVSPENHDKYRKQVQTGVSFYLDAYVNPPSSPHYIGPTNNSRTETFSNNLKYAAQTTDKYIWTWGEKYRWFSTPRSQVSPKYWEEVLPGVTNALNSVRNPFLEAKLSQAKLQEKYQELERAGKLTNLIQNGSFNRTTQSNLANTAYKDDLKKMGWKSSKISNWSTWQREIKGKPLGSFEWDATVDHTGEKDSGAARISGMHDQGTFLQNVNVQPGEAYAVRVWQRFALKISHATVTIKWRDNNNKWTNKEQNVTLFPNQHTSANEWHEIVGYVRVPDGAVKLVIHLEAAKQKSPQDIVWYDDVQVYKLK